MENPSQAGEYLADYAHGAEDRTRLRQPEPVETGWPQGRNAPTPNGATVFELGRVESVTSEIGFFPGGQST